MNGQTKKPTAGTVIGILNVVFCSLGILGALFSILYVSAFMPFLKKLETFISPPEINMLKEDLLQITSQFMEVFIPVFIVIYIIRILNNGAGLAGGIGLLSSKKWGRSLCLLYAFVIIILNITNSLFSYFIVRDALNQFSAVIHKINIPENVNQSAVPFGLRFLNMWLGMSIVIGAVLGSVYPIIAIVMMNARKVKEYYTAV